MVWAPNRDGVELLLKQPGYRARVPMTRGELGYYCAAVDSIAPGTKYMYRLDGPTSGPTQPLAISLMGYTARQRSWIFIIRVDGMQWKGCALEDSVFYELHVGTYTREGTFRALIPRLGQLKDLGVTTIELMPIAQFPGGRNWGYDGVYPYAPQNTYGTPRDCRNW